MSGLEEQILDFMKNDIRFTSGEANPNRHWYYKKDSEIGFAWFKYGLGGWSFLFNGKVTKINSLSDLLIIIGEK